MPINATAEFYKAQEKYLNAKTRKEKISALEEMLRTAPSHKGAEKLRAQLRAKLAKLKSQKPSKVSRKSFGISKEGNIQVCILGVTQSGKSTILKKLTNTSPKISSRPYTTVKPNVGMAEWNGVKIQVIEIPSTFQPMWMSIAQSSDIIIITYDNRRDIEKQKRELKRIMEIFKINKPLLEVFNKEIDPEKIKEKIWKMCGKIRVFTKEPGKKPEKKAIVLEKDSIIRDVARNVHKDFLKFFKFAKIWGPSAKFPGERVGLDHKLKDGDIVEIHTSG